MHSFQLKQSLCTLSSQRWLRGLACAGLCLLLAACGFKLKGVSPLPFDTLYTNIAENSAFGSKIRRAIEASSPNTHFVSDPIQAQAKLIQLSNNQSLRELSIDAQGQVEEYELNLVFVFQLTDAKGHLLLPPTTLQATREIPYDANVVQAKQGEIGALFNEMQQSMVDRVVRRLTSPDVIEAYKNAGDLPVDEKAVNTAPLAPTTPTPVPTPFNIPGVQSGAQMR